MSQSVCGCLMLWHSFREPNLERNVSVLKWKHTVPRAVMCKAVVISKGYTRKNRQMNKRMKKKCRCIFFHVSGMLISTQVNIIRRCQQDKLFSGHWYKQDFDHLSFPFAFPLIQWDSNNDNAYFPLLYQSGLMHGCFIWCYLRKWGWRASLILRIWATVLSDLYPWSFNDLFQNWVKGIDHSGFRSGAGTITEKHWLNPSV